MTNDEEGFDYEYKLYNNIEVRWSEILLDALEKSIWPCLRNTVRAEMILILVVGLF